MIVSKDDLNGKHDSYSSHKLSTHSLNKMSKYTIGFNFHMFNVLNIAALETSTNISISSLSTNDRAFSSGKKFSKVLIESFKFPLEFSKGVIPFKFPLEFSLEVFNLLEFPLEVFISTESSVSP